MKKLSMLLFVFVLLATACKNRIEEYRSQIDDLSTSWQETSAMVTEFAGQVNGEQAKAQTMLAQMNIPEGFTLTQENLQKAKDLKGVVQANLGKLTGIAEGLIPFVTNWQDRGNEMKALTSGMETGALPADVGTQITTMKETVDNARTQLDDWKSSYQEATGGYTDAYESFMALLPEDDESDS